MASESPASLVACWEKAAGVLAKAASVPAKTAEVPAKAAVAPARASGILDRVSDDSEYLAACLVGSDQISAWDCDGVAFCCDRAWRFAAESPRFVMEDPGVVTFSCEVVTISG
jgi:hypothetical protein